MTARLIGVVAGVLAAVGCAAPPLEPSITHDETQVFRAAHFDWARLKSGGIALLGVTSTVAPEGIREDVGFVLDQAASNNLTRVRVVTRGDAAARAREVGMGADLAGLMREYELHSTIDAGLLRRFAAAEGVRYFLLTRVVQYDRVTRTISDPSNAATRPHLAPPKRAAERVQRIRLRGDVWDSRCGDLVWTGEGGTEAVEGTESEAVRMQDVLAMAATNLVKQLPRSTDAPRAAQAAGQETGKECGV